jgi:hypothetical protein
MSSSSAYSYVGLIDNKTDTPQVNEPDDLSEIENEILFSNPYSLTDKIYLFYYIYLIQNKSFLNYELQSQLFVLSGLEFYNFPLSILLNFNDNLSFLLH